MRETAHQERINVPEWKCHQPPGRCVHYGDCGNRYLPGSDSERVQHNAVRTTRKSDQSLVRKGLASAGTSVTYTAGLDASTCRPRSARLPFCNRRPRSAPFAGRPQASSSNWKFMLSVVFQLFPRGKLQRLLTHAAHFVGSARLQQRLPLGNRSLLAPAGLIAQPSFLRRLCSIRSPWRR